MLHLRRTGRAGTDAATGRGVLSLCSVYLPSFEISATKVQMEFKTPPEPSLLYTNSENLKYGGHNDGGTQFLKLKVNSAILLF